MVPIVWPTGGPQADPEIAEAVRRHIPLIIPKDRYAEEDEVLARLRRREHVDHFETVRVRKDGTSIDISLTV